jgi:23S rRNA (uracil1939-C5)-methyltransferase
MAKILITGQIESIAFGGSGILKDNGLVIFIPFTAPQDQVTAAIRLKKKNFAQGSLISLQSPGPDRIEPVCPYFGTCGGCQFQHLSYPAQLEIKRRFIADALQRIAKLPIPVPPIAAAPYSYQYRCHITLRLKTHLTGFQAGYTSWDHTHFIPIAECPIFCSRQDPILSYAQDLTLQLDNTNIEEASLRIFKSEDKYIFAFQFFPHHPSNSALCEETLKKHPSIQAILIHSPKGRQTFGTPICHTESLGISASFSPYGFLQNYPEQRDAMYRAILADLPDSTTKVLDLYCGIGITSLLFAKLGKTVMGIESNPESIAIAKHNAEHNRINNITFQATKVEDQASCVLKTFKPDSVLCNPPREGLDPALIQTLVNERVPYIQYLSCMPSTLARDIKTFTAQGYILEKIQGFDMFPQTTHVETLVLLRCKDKE